MVAALPSLIAQAEAAARIGVGLLATLDSLERASGYFYLSRDMDYLALVAQWVRERGGPDCAGPSVKVLESSRESVFHRNAAHYERQAGLDGVRPLLVDSGFHGNVLYQLRRRWPRAQGRLLESHSPDWPSSRVALALAGLRGSGPSARKYWVERHIEEVSHKTAKLRDYGEYDASYSPIHRPERPADAERYVEVLGEAAAHIDMLGIYQSVRASMTGLASSFRRPPGQRRIVFVPASFPDDRAVGEDLHQRYVEMALRDLCQDLSWRGLANGTTIEVVDRSTDSWSRVAAEAGAESGVQVTTVPTRSEQDGDHVVDARHNPNPQTVVSRLVREIDATFVGQGSAADRAVETLTNLGLLQPAVADLIDAVRLRPGDWDQSRLEAFVTDLTMRGRPREATPSV